MGGWNDLAGCSNELKDLTAIPATSGFEQEIARRLVDEMRPLTDRVEVDPFGNVYGTVEGSPNGPRVLIPAHSDSVGMIVSHIEDNGYLRFDVVGSVPANLTYAQRVLIGTPQGPRTGVVGSKPGHIAFREQVLGTTVPTVDALFIDVGASSKSAVQRMGIEPGQQVTWDRELAWLGEPSTGLVTGRSLDDKVGCLAMLEAMRSIRASGGRAARDRRSSSRRCKRKSACAAPHRPRVGPSRICASASTPPCRKRDSAAAWVLTPARRSPKRRTAWERAPGSR